MNEAQSGSSDEITGSGSPESNPVSSERSTPSLASTGYVERAWPSSSWAMAAAATADRAHSCCRPGTRSARSSSPSPHRFAPCSCADRLPDLSPRHQDHLDPGLLVVDGPRRNEREVL